MPALQAAVTESACRIQLLQDDLFAEYGSEYPEQKPAFLDRESDGQSQAKRVLGGDPPGRACPLHDRGDQPGQPAGWRDQEKQPDGEGGVRDRKIQWESPLQARPGGFRVSLQGNCPGQKQRQNGTKPGGNQGGQQRLRPFVVGPQSQPHRRRKPRRQRPVETGCQRHKDERHAGYGQPVHGLVSSW